MGIVQRYCRSGPCDDEDSLTAKSLQEYLTFTLSVFNKDWTNVSALIGDNCATNKAVANSTGVGFIGCASHRFNLAVQDILVQHDDIITIVNDLMKKLRNLVPAAKLRQFTPLAAKTRNDTRWSSTYQMISRYFEIRSMIRQIDLPEVRLLLPTEDEEAELSDLFKKLQQLDTVTKSLQSEKMTVSLVRYIFDEVISRFPCTKHRLSTTARIVHNSDFENGIVKILEGRASELTSEEKKQTNCFLIPGGLSEFENISDTDSIFESACKKCKYDYVKNNRAYEDLRYILPTSNHCERLFSRAGYCMNSRRQAILPSNIEAQVFLNCNSSFWGIADLNKIMRP